MAKAQVKSPDFISDDEMEKIAPSGPDFISDEDMATMAGPKTSVLDAGRIGLEKSVTFGTRPALKGIGAAQETFIKTLADKKDGEGIIDLLKRAGGAAGDAFSGKRQATIQEQDKAHEDQPIPSIAGQVFGTVLTAPFTAARTIKGMTALGGLYGTGTAIGESDSLADAGEKIATGIGTGAGFGVVSKFGPGVIKKGAELLGKGTKKVASALTGVSEREISTYASRADEVKRMLAESGDDIAVAADNVRSQVTKEIQGARQKLSGQITKALNDPKYQRVDVDGRPILLKLEESLSQISGRTSQFKNDQVNELKNVIDLTKQAMSQDGTLDLVTLNSLKEELQNIAKPSYNNGQLIFSRGDLAAKASKNAAAEARRLLNNVAPEIKQANQQLSKLHFIEDNMNKNLIRAGKPEAGLISAGSGGNPRNAKMLTALDEITGGTAQRQAENLAAARTFGSPQILPTDFTGKSLTRMLSGAGAGTILGGPAGGAIGTALTSPMSTKLALDSARLLKTVTNPLAQGISNLARRPGVQSGILKEAENALLSNPMERRLRLIRSGNSNQENQ